MKIHVNIFIVFVERLIEQLKNYFFGVGFVCRVNHMRANKCTALLVLLSGKMYTKVILAIHTTAFCKQYVNVHVYASYSKTY